ncbi:MAG: hypothetical protein M0Z61_18565 [Nitrospiraceae bacterium]|nr:hypothetical protein [Nitrospiraceae bacterium]
MELISFFFAPPLRTVAVILTMAFSFSADLSERASWTNLKETPGATKKNYTGCPYVAGEVRDEPEDRKEHHQMSPLNRADSFSCLRSAA